MESDRRVFVLRVWKSSNRTEWCASLLDVPAGQALHFATLAEFYAALCAQLDSG